MNDAKRLHGQIKNLRVEFNRRMDAIERSLAPLLRDLQTGPENCREEVSPMGANTTRDWCTARLGAAPFQFIRVRLAPAR